MQLQQAFLVWKVLQMQTRTFFINLDQIKNLICQHHEHGWWLFVYPFTHIEWEPGCLYFSEMSPRENGKGYDVYIHYLFNPSVPADVRSKFIEMAEITFDEDITAVNEISSVSTYRMPSNAPHKLEADIKHFYKWIEDNTE